LSSSDEHDRIPFTEILNYLNQKTGKHFRYKTKTYRSFIQARWNEGMRLEDFHKVIDSKFERWGSDPEMIDYLRPQTLFGTKMDSYLNEQIHVPENKYFKNHVGNYECRICSKSYSKLENLMEHLKEHD